MPKTITKYTTISTKKGDTGSTRNYSNDLIPKTDILFDTLGLIDQLSSTLGITYHYSKYKTEIQSIQLDLQHINSILATNIDDKNRSRLKLITKDDIDRLEQLEQTVLEECAIEPRFVLPGSDSTLEGAYLDLSRSLARNVERQIIEFNNVKERADLEYVLSYFNRLSDLLFIFARSVDEKK